MSIKIKFGIEEHPDAKSFMFFDITGQYDAQFNPEGWGDPNLEPGDVTSARLDMREHTTDKVLSFQLPLDVSLWEEGIEFTKESSTSTVELEKFNDGAYEFSLYINGVKYSQRSFGFYAQIKEQVMKESLAYRPERERVYREVIWEKLRLLDNLFYSTETDQIKHFVENLTQLKKLR